MKHLILSALLCIVCTAGFAQQNHTRVSISAGETLRLTSIAFGPGYETLRTTVRVQVEHGILKGGVGYEFPLQGGAGELELRGGCTFGIKKLSSDIFIALQRPLSADNALTLAGSGLNISLNIAGPVHLFTEFRAMCPILENMRYRYNRTLICNLAFGVSIKF